MKRKLRILLIDDDEMIHEIVRETLPEDEFELGIEADAPAGFREVLCFDPDLILLDFVFPTSNGLEVLNELKGHKLTRDIPVIAISFSDSTGLIECFYKYGAIDFIVKPINPGILREKIRSLAVNMELIDRLPKTKPRNVIGLYGVSGGVGTSSVAANTAYTLSKQVAEDDKKVLLMETNCFHSYMQYFFDAKGCASFHSLMNKHLYDIDEEFLLHELCQADTNFFILPSGDQLGQFEMAPNVHNLHIVIHTLSEHFDYIVVDMDRTFSDVTKYILENSALLMLVTSPANRDLQNLHDTANMLARCGVGRDKVGVVINCLEREDEIDVDGMLQFLGIPCKGMLSKHSDEFNEAERNQVLVVTGSNSNVIMEYKELAGKVLETIQHEIRESPMI